MATQTIQVPLDSADPDGAVALQALFAGPTSPPPPPLRTAAPPQTLVAAPVPRPPGLFRPQDLFETVSPDRRRRPVTPTSPAPASGRGAPSEGARSGFSVGGDTQKDRALRAEGRRELLARLFELAAKALEWGLVSMGIQDMAGYGERVHMEVQSGRYQFLLHRLGTHMSRLDVPLSLEVALVLGDSIASHISDRARQRRREDRQARMVAAATHDLYAVRADYADEGVGDGVAGGAAEEEEDDEGAEEEEGDGEDEDDDLSATGERRAGTTASASVSGFRIPARAAGV